MNGPVGSGKTTFPLPLVLWYKKVSPAVFVMMYSRFWANTHQLGFNLWAMTR